MQAAPPDPPYGLNVAVHSESSISLTWQRPKGLIRSYTVQYGNVGSDEREMREMEVKAGLTIF